MNLHLLVTAPMVYAQMTEAGQCHPPLALLPIGIDTL